MIVLKGLQERLVLASEMLVEARTRIRQGRLQDAEETLAAARSTAADICGQDKRTSALLDGFLALHETVRGELWDAKRRAGMEL